MLGIYGDILRLPGATRFCLAGAVGRLPLSMAGLGIVLLVVERTGSYRDAGLVSAGYIVTAAIFAPIQGRIADRSGQTPVLLISSTIFAIGISLVLWSAGGPLLTAILCASVAGIGAPQTGNMSRRRWSQLVERRQLNTAFALEAVLEEVVFVVGPVLVTFLTINVEERTGLLTATVCAVAGSWALALQRSTDPGRAERTGIARDPLPAGSLAVVVWAAICLGIMFGSAEVLVVAFTDEQGHKSLSGVVLAVWAASSLLAGLIVGARSWQASPLVRLRLSSGLLAVLFIPLPWVPSIPMLVVVMAATGLMIAPTLIAVTALVESTMPMSRLTEAFMWMGAGLAAGVAPGASVSGWVIDQADASAGFVVPLLAAATTALIAIVYRSPSASRRG